MSSEQRESGTGDAMEPIASRRNRGAVVSGRVALETPSTDPEDAANKTARRAASVALMRAIAEQ